MYGSDSTTTQPETTEQGPVPAVPATVDATPALEPPAVPMLPMMAAPRRYLARFAFIYVGLGLTLVGAVTGGILLALQPGPPAPKPWSSWRPGTSNVTKAVQEIADHVSSAYHMNASGSPLVAVLTGTPELTQNAKVLSVSTIAIRTTPQSQSYSRIFSTSGTYQDQFCGLGSFCSIKTGKPTASRARLVRREALEIALYTFKYVPQIGALIAYMPPPPGQAPSTLLLLERSDFKTQLSEPLAKTLPLTKPPLPSAPDTLEAAKIDKLTLPLQYSFQYATTTDGSLALILAAA